MSSQPFDDGSSRHVRVTVTEFQLRFQHTKSAYAVADGVLGRTDGVAGVGMRGTPVRPDRAFALVEVCGLFAYDATHGDDQGVAAMTLFRDIVRTDVSRHGARIVRWLGVGVLFIG